MRVLVLHGPNVNLLPDAAQRFERDVKAHGTTLGLEVETFQANSEGALVDELHRRREWCEAVVVNAGVLAPFAVALAETLSLLKLRAVEVQLTPRESSALKGVAEHQVRGEKAYLEALDVVADAGEPAPPESPSRRGKTIGRKQAAGVPEAAAPTKTLGRKSAPSVVPSSALSRADVHAQVSQRLAGKVAPEALAAWARSQWQALMNGAEVEPGAKDVLEDVLLTLAASAKASEHVLLSAVAKLER